VLHVYVRRSLSDLLYTVSEDVAHVVRRLLCLRLGAIVRNVFWSDPNLDDGSFRTARAPIKRTHSPATRSTCPA